MSGVIVSFLQIDTVTCRSASGRRQCTRSSEAFLQVLVAAGVFCAERVNLENKYEYP